MGCSGPCKDARPAIPRGVADMKFRIDQYALTAVVAAYTLVHTFGAKWG
jgi:hypothetical protein